MTAQWLKGKPCADALKKDIAQRVAKRIAQGHPPPCLAVILVGSNPASESYVGHKVRACEQTGIRSQVHRFQDNCSQEDIASCINALNTDENVDGILLQLPLPADLDSAPLLSLVSPDKDVDGFHPTNMGHLVQKQPRLRPCTPFGVMKLLEYYQLPVSGKHAVVVGASNIVGRPMALELLLADATVTICNSKTQNLAKKVAQADILVCATGKHQLVKSEWIKPGSIVIDVGFMRLESGQIVGDLDSDVAAKRAAWITPVPGGVGLMTVATLLENTLLACELHSEGHLLKEKIS